MSPAWLQVLSDYFVRHPKVGATISFGLILFMIWIFRGCEGQDKF